jgi:hypothetical protein
MANVNWSTSIQVAGGPTVSASQGPIQAEATERIQVSIAAGDAGKVVSLQPGPASAIHLLLIQSSYYGADLSFTVGDGAADSAPLSLLGPQFFSGGSAALFGLDPHLLKFTNAGANNASIEIFIARDATP